MQKNAAKILLAEDELAIARMMEIKLQAAGFTVTLVENGKQAVEATAKDSFDVIILDVIMPQMDGFTALETIRKQNIKTPIIIASNLGQPEDKKRALELGANEYFIKTETPLNLLIERIKGHLLKT